MKSSYDLIFNMVVFVYLVHMCSHLWISWELSLPPDGHDEYIFNTISFGKEGPKIP